MNQKPEDEKEKHENEKKNAACETNDSRSHTYKIRDHYAIKKVYILNMWFLYVK